MVGGELPALRVEIPLQPNGIACVQRHPRDLRRQSRFINCVCVKVDHLFQFGLKRNVYFANIR